MTDLKRKRITTLPVGKRLKTQIPKPSHYECPEGPAYIETAGKRIRIQVLLDSGSNIFLINKDLVKHFDIPYETRQKALNILAFDGEVNSSGGKHFTHPILLEIGNNGHRTTISCEVAAAGKYDLIIPFGWWHREHPITNITEPKSWTFTEKCCQEHVEDEAIGDMFEWDETVAYDEEAQYCGRICRAEDPNQVLLDKLPQPYEKYKELFLAKTAEKLAEPGKFDHAIDLKPGAEPPWGPIYPMSAYQLDLLDKYLKKMLKEGKIVHSQSPAGAPILFVPKPGGELRLCVDYRNLNKLTILNKYPLPLMGELKDRVAGATIFTKLDLKDGYNLLRIREGDEWKTAFRTRYGHFEYKVMPFGLVNAPATFQAMMNKVLREFLDHGVVVYLDDILIYSSSVKEHEELVTKVLEKLRENRLAVSITKSVFHVESVEFLGYIVTTQGVTMSERKVESIKNWKAPRSVKEVQIFIGFANFYRRFIKGFSDICAPITGTLSGKEAFHWGTKQDRAFEELKKRFITAPILEHFYPERETVVETDASDFALGCVLSQFKEKRLHPVAFHSRKLNPAERNYEIHDKELLAILEAFKEWRHYLIGSDKPITVYTDHQNLQNFLTTKIWNRRQIRWAQRLADYNFRIVYRPGKRGGKPDALSRRPEYRPEEGAEHSEQSILKPEHFEVSLIHEDDEDEGYVTESEKTTEHAIRIKRLSSKANLPTKGSRLAAGHDLYAISEFIIPAQGQVMAETGIAIGLPPGTYARIAPRSGLASKKGIAVNGGVIDADYTGEIKVILVNHSQADCRIQVGDRIAQIIVEKINTSDVMEVDNLDMTERSDKGFGSTDLSPKRTIKATESKPMICFLQADIKDNEYFDSEDIGKHPRLMKEHVMMSSAIISQVEMRTFNADFIREVEIAGERDQEWTQRRQELETLEAGGNKAPKNWQTKQGLLYYKNRLYIPDNEELQTTIAKGCHDSQVAGHFGQEKTIEIVTRDFYWKGLTAWINDYVRSCDECQHNKSPRHARYGLLQPLQIPFAAWTSISTDFITHLPESQGHTQIMVVVDRFTKMSHFIGLKENATAKDVADVFLREVWKLHGLPTEIISDMDAKFSGEFWESLCKSLNIKRKMSTAYHPQTDGQTERTNQTLEGYLRNFVNYDQDDWYQLLPLAEHAYNNSATSAHGMSPFYANYGFHPQTEWMKEREAQNPGAGLYAHWMQTTHHRAKTALEKTRADMARYYDRKARQQPDIKVGDLVMLNAKNIRTKRPTKKLSPKLYGPFKVLEIKGERAFKLEISPRWKIHPIFHVSLLEPYRASVREGREQPPRMPEEIEGDLEWEVERIVKSEVITYTRRVGRRNRTFKELRYFVKWKGCAEDENTWEPPEGLANAQEIVDRFHRQNPGMPGLAAVE